MHAESYMYVSLLSPLHVLQADDADTRTLTLGPANPSSPGTPSEPCQK